jgi:hypothetical protein
VPTTGGHHPRQVRAATGLALLWARAWGARPVEDPATGLLVCAGMRGGHGRGGTTIGRVFLTGHRAVGPELLRHEAVHARQWDRHGLGFAARYLVEECRRPRERNRFEQEAGLADGGYPEV